MKSLYLFSLLFLLFISCDNKIEEETCSFCQTYNGLLKGTATIAGETETIIDRPIEIILKKNGSTYSAAFTFEFGTNQNFKIDVDGLLNIQKFYFNNEIFGTDLFSGEVNISPKNHYLTGELNIAGAGLGKLTFVAND